MQDEQNVTEQNTEVTDGVEEEVAAASEAGDEAQSEDQAQQAEEAFEWSGRKLSGKELYEEARRLQSEYTRKSQELAEIRKANEPRVEAKQEDDPFANMSPEERVQYEQVAKNLSPFMKKVLAQEIESYVQNSVQQSLTQKELQQQFQQQFKEAEKYAKEWGVTYDQNSLIDYMKSTGNGDIVSAFKNMHEAAYLDHQIKQRQAKKKPIYSEQGSAAPKKMEEPQYDGVTDPRFRANLTDKLRKMMGG